MLPRLALILAVGFALAATCSAVDPDPTSIRTAIDTLEPSVKTQAADIRSLKNTILSKGTIGDGAQLQSASQRVMSAVNSAATNETVVSLQSEAIGLLGEVNAAHAATQGVTHVMSSAAGIASEAERNSIALIDEAATAKSQIDEARARLDKIVDDGDSRADAFPIKADVFDDIEASLSALEDEIDEMLEDVAEFPDAKAQTLVDMYNNMPGFRPQGGNTKVVYRYGYFDNYTPQGGWALGNNADLFAGINPSSWSGGTYAWSITSNMEPIRAFFTETGYLGPQGNLFARSKYFFSTSTLGGHMGVLFRIRNNSPSTISHRFYFYYSVYGSSYDDHTSVAFNRNSVWSSTNLCSSCTSNFQVSFPGNKVSTLIFFIGLSPFSSNMRVPNLQFYSNSLRLPSSLQYVDDLDTASSWA